LSVIIFDLLSLIYVLKHCRVLKPPYNKLLIFGQLGFFNYFVALYIFWTLFLFCFCEPYLVSWQIDNQWSKNIQ